MTNPVIHTTSLQLFEKIVALVDQSRSKAAAFLNAETTWLYWSIGHYISTELKQKDQISYGKQILVTLSQQLTDRLGKGFAFVKRQKRISVDTIDYRLMLDEKDIKVAQYLTELPSKAWFADKLHRAIAIAKSQTRLFDETR
jgi:hypothetical protein